VKTIRVLHLEDNPDDVKQFGRWLREAWTNLKNGTELEIRSVSTPEEATALLQDGKHGFQLMIADIYFGVGRKSQELPLGLHAIAEARRRGPHMVIVALSVADNQGREAAIEHGADEFFSKSSMRARIRAVDDMALRLERLLKSASPDSFVDEGLAVVLGEKGVRLQAVVHGIGVNVIRYVCRELVGDSCSRIDIGYVRPGLSGAAVVSVVAQYTLDGKETIVRVLLKISRDGDALRRELKNRERVRTFPARLFVVSDTPAPVEFRGWWAISAPYLHNAQTLQNFLTQPGVSAADVREALSRLCLTNGLRDVAQRPSIDEGMSASDVLGCQMTLDRRARMRLAIDELGRLAEKYAGGVYSRELLETFVEQNRFGEIDPARPKKGTMRCWAHGDLHTRNVLIHTRNEPVLIDAANIDSLHWASDLARLTADLFVSCLDAGDWAYEWSRLPHWLDEAKVFIEEGTVAEMSEEETSALLAVRWVRDMRKSILGSCLSPAVEWEWDLALAIEFLRSSYRVQDVSAPKRAFALAAACVALRAAERRYLLAHGAGEYE
jgi:CheY-like chemotaxis protein